MVFWLCSVLLCCTTLSFTTSPKQQCVCQSASLCLCITGPIQRICGFKSFISGFTPDLHEVQYSIGISTQRTMEYYSSVQSIPINLNYISSSHLHGYCSRRQPFTFKFIYHTKKYFSLILHFFKAKINIPKEKLQTSLYSLLFKDGSVRGGAQSQLCSELSLITEQK